MAAGFAVMLLFCAVVGGLCEHSRNQLLQQFNCKKIAFYKTHKTGSTTLGGVLFRVAAASNMSLYTTLGSHYVSLGYKENQRLLSHSDMVLRHIRFSEGPGFHATTRSFYGRALGTAEYGFITVLRHPVDRYISDFHYYAEPDARRASRQLTLRQYAAKGQGANRMAREFAVRDAAEAVEFVAAEMHSEGLYLPLELLDYGLALLSLHCGWGLSRVMYLPTNVNVKGVERYGNVTLLPRPTLEQLAKQDLALLDRIAAINSIDAILYGAAYAQLLARLQMLPGLTSAVMSEGVRLTAARKRLEAECRGLHGSAFGDPSLSSSPLLPPPSPRGPISALELAGICTWYSMPDSVYEKLSSMATGRVAFDTVLLSPSPPYESWPVGHLIRLAEEHFSIYDANASEAPYYHSVLAVHVKPPTAAEAKLVYGLASGGEDRGDQEVLAALTAAVRLWTIHHAREGLHHLVFLVGNLYDTRQVDLLRAAAAAALGYSGNGASASTAAANGTALPFTTFSVLRCDSGAAAATSTSADGTTGENDGDCSSAWFADTVARSRWSAVLPGLTYFLYGVRGTVRSILLSIEGAPYAAGAVCAPLLPWRTRPDASVRPTAGSQSGDSGGSGPGGVARRQAANGCGESGPIVVAAEREDIFEGNASVVGTLGEVAEARPIRHGEVPRLGASGGKSVGSLVRQWRLALEVMGVQSGQVELRGSGVEDGAGDSRKADGMNEVGIETGFTRAGELVAAGGNIRDTASAASTAETSSAGAGGHCLRIPCSFAAPKDSLRCVMLRGMAILGRTQSYTSTGVVLPEGQASYRVSYRGPEQHRLEVARLAPPSEEDFVQADVTAALAGSRETLMGGPGRLDSRCLKTARPRLRVPWCGEARSGGG